MMCKMARLGKIGNFMTERLGAWKKAPLAYVLAEVRIKETLADLKSYQPDLRRRLPALSFRFKRTLVTARIVNASSEGAPTLEPSQEGAWELATPDNRLGLLILRPQGFVLHATTYKDHREFLGRFQEACLR